MLGECGICAPCISQPLQNRRADGCIIWLMIVDFKQYEYLMKTPWLHNLKFSHLIFVSDRLDISQSVRYLICIYLYFLQKWLDEPLDGCKWLDIKIFSRKSVFLAQTTVFSTLTDKQRTRYHYPKIQPFLQKWLP